MRQAWTAFWDFVDQRTVVRRVALGIVFWMTIEAFFWTFEFAKTSPRPGGDVAAIIGVIWAPLTALQGAVIAFYNSARQGAQNVTQP